MGRIKIANRLLLAAQTLHVEMIVYLDDTKRLHKLASDALEAGHSKLSVQYCSECASAVAKWQDAADKFQKVYRYAETFSRAVMQA